MANNRNDKHFRTLVTDLEATLITTVYDMMVHPQAAEVLKRAEKDLDSTILWTRAPMDLTLNALKRTGLLPYFDSIIVSEEQNRWFLDLRLSVIRKNGSCSSELHREYLPLSEHKKDLTLLGNPNHFVLIDDEPTYGYPINRVVHIPEFYGQEDHNLHRAYEKALRRFR